LQAELKIPFGFPRGLEYARLLVPSEAHAELVLVRTGLSTVRNQVIGASEGHSIGYVSRV
jgi:hypothetical protein